MRKGNIDKHKKMEEKEGGESDEGGVDCRDGDGERRQVLGDVEGEKRWRVVFCRASGGPT